MQASEALFMEISDNNNTSWFSVQIVNYDPTGMKSCDAFDISMTQSTCIVNKMTASPQKWHL